jgi:hypothetical protein
VGAQSRERNANQALDGLAQVDQSNACPDPSLHHRQVVRADREPDHAWFENFL